MKPTALITGASGGLGAAIARALAPSHRTLLGGRDRAALTALAGHLPDAEPWPVDLTDAEAVAAACGEVAELDVLVHNAGVCELGTVAETAASVWRNTFEVNVVAVAELTRLLLPALRRTEGHVVLINSGAGQRAHAGWGAYAASKFALRAFADVLRQEEPAVRVTSVHPGRIDTDMQRAVVAHEGRDYDAAEFMQPSSVAAAVLAAVQTPPDAHPVEVVLRPR